MKQNIRRLFQSPFGRLYDEAGLPGAIRRSLFFIIIGNLCGNIHGTITMGSALAGYAGALGANDFVFGVLTAIPFFGTVMQIAAAGMVSRAGRRKKYMLLYGTISRSMWVLIGTVPLFLPMDPLWLRIWTVIFLSGIASVSSSFINVCFTSWLADLVPIRIRGRWLSCRDRIIAVVGVAVGLLTAMILDNLPGTLGYTIVFVAGGIIGVIDMFCFLPAVDPPLPTSDTRSFRGVMIRIFQDKVFFRFMLFWTVWSFTSNIAGPYYTRFALESEKLSFLQITVCGQIAVAVITVLVISRWGRVIDSYGCKPTLWISCTVTALSPVFMLFSTPGNPVMFLLFNVVGSAFWVASNLAASNLLMASSPQDQRPSYIAVYSCFTSIAGSFFGVLLGGALLQWLPGFMAAKSITLGGHAPNHYKIVIGLGVICRLATVFLLVPGLDNDRESTAKDLIRNMARRLLRTP